MNTGSLSDADFWKGSHAFTVNLLMASVSRNIQIGFERGDPDDILREIVTFAIVRGLEVGLIRPDGPRPTIDNIDKAVAAKMLENWDEAVPWSVVLQNAQHYGVDAQAIFDELKDMRASINMEDLSGEYVLHCHHDNHDCAHPYRSIDEAIADAAAGLSRGDLQHVSQITCRGETVLERIPLLARIEFLHNHRHN